MKWEKSLVFQGSSALTLDAKGRMSIPARHRDALLAQEQGRLTLTRHPDGCLMIYPRSTWEAKREQIAALPASARPLQRLLLGNAQDVDMDGAGRILVAPELRTAAGLNRDVMLLGLGSNFELWDRAQWEARCMVDVGNLDPAILEQISF
ncbi:division/cell wall cluster transcriptional repressor MraZ [Castellaniella daejeonensis]|jgi:MraZ protein|uniref:Transcriptional regulator MraZ n=1 Tax=Castellaniella daejeonensis TaxID=659013 RepID=A0ABN0T8N8_9BURK